MPQVDLSNEDLFEATSLIYRRWAEEYDLLKRVKNEKDDGSDPDYKQMHQHRLKHHTETEAKWKAFLSRMTAVCPRLV